MRKIKSYDIVGYNFVIKNRANGFEGGLGIYIKTSKIVKEGCAFKKQIRKALSKSIIQR